MMERPFVMQWRRRGREKLRKVRCMGYATTAEAFNVVELLSENN